MAAHFWAGLVGCLGPQFSIELMGGFVLIEVATHFFHRAGERAWRRNLVGGHGLLSTLAAHNIGGQWAALAQDNSKMLKLTGPLVNMFWVGWWAALGAYSSA